MKSLKSWNKITVFWHQNDVEVSFVAFQWNSVNLGEVYQVNVKRREDANKQANLISKPTTLQNVEIGLRDAHNR